MGIQRLLGKRVELSGSDLCFELTVPRLGVKRDEPFPQLRHLFRREALDLAFNLLNFAHAASIPHRYLLTANDRDEQRVSASSDNRADKASVSIAWLYAFILRLVVLVHGIRHWHFEFDS